MKKSQSTMLQLKHLKPVKGTEQSKAWERFLKSDKSYFFIRYTNFDKVEIFHILGHVKPTLLTRVHSEHETRNHMQRSEPDICKSLIKRWILDDSDEIKIMLLCYRSFLTFRIYIFIVVKCFKNWPIGFCLQ